MLTDKVWDAVCWSGCRWREGNQRAATVASAKSTEEALISVLILERIPKSIKGNMLTHSAIHWDIKAALI
ncbi:hypothetical protein NPIL_663151 [Nephila pilipes]|uniref:Uncharacterized protein n=1 Tax=Nephila pilipes TaxID=299642 RepID=A0A8X6QC29_NEPPI|nr:hypothetical protein NPIL_663151 [Nephila pilipes]